MKDKIKIPAIMMGQYVQDGEAPYFISIDGAKVVALSFEDFCEFDSAEKVGFRTVVAKVPVNDDKAYWAYDAFIDLYDEYDNDTTGLENETLQNHFIELWRYLTGETLIFKEGK